MAYVSERQSADMDTGDTYGYIVVLNTAAGAMVKEPLKVNQGMGANQAWGTTSSAMFYELDDFIIIAVQLQLLSGFEGYKLTDTLSGDVYEESKFRVMRYNYDTNSIEWVVRHEKYFGRATSLAGFPSGLYVGGALNM